jgi:phosphoglycolate phosphatase-like HAD superfamily hydrolase
MTGDAAGDINAGKNAGVTTAGALWGYGNDKDFIRKNADYAFENIEQMRPLLCLLPMEPHIL